jgi:hypothetical protein
MEICLPIGRNTLFDEEIRQNASQAVFGTIWKTPNRPLNIKVMVLRIFGDWFVGNEAASPTFKSSSEELEGFLF